MQDGLPSELKSQFSLGSLVSWLCVLVFIVYPLSTGPVWLLCEELQLDASWDIRLAFYAPLVALCDAFEPVEDFFDWYVGLFWDMW